MNLIVPPPESLITREEIEMADQARNLANAALPLSSQAEAVDAGELLSQMHQLYKLLETRRAEIKAPFLEAGRMIDGAFRDSIDKLSSAMTRVKSLLGNYARKQEDARIEAEREAARHTAEGGVAPITPAVIQAQQAQTIVKTRTMKEVHIVDVDILPRRYLIPNMTLIRSDALAGHPIPGVEVRAVKKSVV